MASPKAMTSLVALALLGLASTVLAETSSLQDLADRLVGRSRSHVRGRAIAELWKLDPAGKAALVPLLLPGLRRSDAYERMNAAYALGWLDHHAWPARENLRGLLVDPSEMVRHQARATLGRLGEDRAGRDSVIGHVRQLFAHLPDETMNADVLITDGTTVVAEVTSRGTDRAGQLYELRFTEVFELSDGKVIEICTYVDPDDVETVS